MRRTKHTSDSKKYFDWLEASAVDLLAARILLEKKQCFEISAFLCQQCIEKSLKAYLLFETGRLFDGHNITWLCRQAGKQDRAFNVWISKLATMSRLYIETRYPSDVELGLNSERVGEVYEVAHEIYDLVCLKIYDEDNVPPLGAEDFE